MGNDLADLAAAIDELVGTEACMLTDPALRAELFGLRTIMDRLDHRYATLLAVADRRGLALVDGHGSTPKWVQAKCGRSKRDAKRFGDRISTRRRRRMLLRWARRTRHLGR